MACFDAFWKDTGMEEHNRGYEVVPRPAALGGGWKLTLLEDGQEAGGGVFPVPEDSPKAGMDWWNSLPGKDRGYWMLRAASARPADARHAYLLAEAYSEAVEEAESWVRPA